MHELRRECGCRELGCVAAFARRTCDRNASSDLARRDEADGRDVAHADRTQPDRVGLAERAHTTDASEQLVRPYERRRFLGAAADDERHEFVVR